MSYDAIFGCFALGVCLGAALNILHRARRTLLDRRRKPRTVTTPARRASDKPQPATQYHQQGLQSDAAATRLASRGHAVAGVHDAATTDWQQAAPYAGASVAQLMPGRQFVVPLARADRHTRQLRRLVAADAQRTVTMRVPPTGLIEDIAAMPAPDPTSTVNGSRGDFGGSGSTGDC